MPTDRELLDELVTASQNMLTVSRNAGAVLSEEFESMINGPADVLEAVLNKCPNPSTFWDGYFDIEHCDVEAFTPDVVDGVNRVNVGCRVTHRLTGISREASQHPDFENNKRIAVRALEAAVLARGATANRKDPRLA